MGRRHDLKLVERAERVTAEEVAGTGIRWRSRRASPCRKPALGPHLRRLRRQYETGFRTLGAAAVRGLQGKKLSADEASVLACAKTFIGDGGTENGRTRAMTSATSDAAKTLSAAVSRRDQGGRRFHHGFLQQLERPKMHGNKYLLTDVLKGELGFQGFLVSDWAAIDQLSPITNTTLSNPSMPADMMMIPYGPGHANNYVEFINDLNNWWLRERSPVAH